MHKAANLTVGMYRLACASEGVQSQPVTAAYC